MEDEEEDAPRKKKGPPSTSVCAYMSRYMLTSLTYSLLQQKIHKISDEESDINNNILALKNHWTCNDASCPSENGGKGSDFCWIDPDTLMHFRLNNARLTVWAAAMVSMHAYIQDFTDDIAG